MDVMLFPLVVKYIFSISLLCWQVMLFPFVLKYNFSISLIWWQVDIQDHDEFCRPSSMALLLLAPAPRRPSGFIVRISPFFDGRTVRLIGSLANRLLRRTLGVTHAAGAGRRPILAYVGTLLVKEDREAREIPARKAVVFAIAAAVEGLGARDRRGDMGRRIGSWGWTGPRWDDGTGGVLHIGRVEVQPLGVKQGGRGCHLVPTRRHKCCSSPLPNLLGQLRVLALLRPPRRRPDDAELLLRMGELAHGLVLRLGHLADVVVATALLDMYAKYGRVADVRWVFDAVLA
ncbi:hypothetical protein HU200_059539 [Digitaria exilis]|uniref:Uncharacterized protein n=1 Tax=Digitaria exilis TaxID=1010633 RepID=A0A835A7Z0_9POAL|nr:hypothetical protein HU200_059539 [Digitaria exilis]